MCLQHPSPYLIHDAHSLTLTSGPTPTSSYCLSSIPATLKKIFKTNSFLTKRSAISDDIANFLNQLRILLSLIWVETPGQLLSNTLLKSSVRVTNQKLPNSSNSLSDTPRTDCPTTLENIPLPPPSAIKEVFPLFIAFVAQLIDLQECASPMNDLQCDIYRFIVGRSTEPCVFTQGEFQQMMTTYLASLPTNQSIVHQYHYPPISPTS